MRQMNVTALSGPLAVRIETAPPPPAPEVLARVAALWRAEKAKRGDALFDGRLFSISRLAPPLVTGWLAPYSWYVAQRLDPALRAGLGLRPLGVTGIMICDEGIVFGRRASTVTTDHDLWELAPSGGVDGEFLTPDGDIDLAAQILNELTEETGLPTALVTAPPRPVALVEDGASLVTDIGLQLRLGCGAAAVRAAFAALASQEYTELAVVAPADLDAFMAAADNGVGRVSRGLIDMLALS
ncbi:hypothetical protein [Zavarzinia sp.]|uniref:hypothetical protein n=1 Tax=Zavarzinia sp. TaxID=2027920 RepID=UPI003BB5A2F7